MVSPSSASSSLGHGCSYLYKKNVPPLLILLFHGATEDVHHVLGKIPVKKYI